MFSMHVRHSYVYLCNHNLHPTDGWTLFCRYLSSMLFQSIRAECAQMDINERVLLTDEAGKSFYVPEL